MKLSNFNLGVGAFIISYHLVVLTAVPLYLMHFTPSWTIIILSTILLYITGMSVTAGYHRLYSHSTYKINPVVEGVLLFFATMATQGSAIRWSYDHRIHHAFLDSDRDPYSIKKGFWYAHFLWLFEKPKEIEPHVVADLMKNPLLRFQHRFYPLLMFATNILTSLVVGWLLNDYVGAFLFVWLTRQFFLHHFTWFINSLAHTWGARTFCQEISAVDNYILSLFTWGEGYHNYHHKFAYDYRNGVRWYHFDPTKWLIWTLHKLSLATNLKRVNSYLLEQKLLLDRKKLLLETVSSSVPTQKEEWEKRITQLFDSLLINLKQVKELREHYSTLKKEGKKDLLSVLQNQIKDLNKSLKGEYRRWMALSRDVTTLPSLKA